MAERRCHYCGRLFLPDPRVGNRQKACSAPCQKLRKKENNRVFRANNPEYWEKHYEYVKEWRRRHPDYQRQWRQKKKAAKERKSSGEIQAERLRKAIGFTGRIYLYLCEIQAEILLKASRKASLILPAP